MLRQQYTPGREMDAAVAKEIMGLRDVHRLEPAIGRDNAIVAHSTWCHLGAWVASYDAECGLFTYTIIDRYSTEIARAWHIDRPEWRWRFEETFTQLVALLSVYEEIGCAYPIDGYDIRVPWATVTDTRPHGPFDFLKGRQDAYAYARCQLALWAVAGQAGR